MQHTIELGEDTTELSGEFAFADVQGFYYIVIMSEVERPLKLSVMKQSESPTQRRVETERRGGEGPSSKKKTYRTPNKEAKSTFDLMEQIK